MKSMKLEIGGVVALALGIWAVSYCRWFVLEVIEGLAAVGLAIGGVLAIAVALRRRYRTKPSENPSH